jgi:hypothetical protein
MAGEMAAAAPPEVEHPDTRMHRLSKRGSIAVVRFGFFMFFPLSFARFPFHTPPFCRRSNPSGNQWEGVVVHYNRCRWRRKHPNDAKSYGMENMFELDFQSIIDYHVNH